MSELTLERATALFAAGRLHELVGIAPNASQAEVKAGCKRAYLRHHPDRGGHTEIFKLVYAASEQLKSDYHCFGFNGPVPAWAEWELARIAAQQDIIRKGENEVASLTRKLERPCSARIKADVRAEMERIQGTIARSRTRLRELRANFVQQRAEHDEKVPERERRQEAKKRQEAMAAEERRRKAAEVAEAQRLQTKRDDRALQCRRRRGEGGARFPSMPKALVDSPQFAIMRREYTKLRRARVARRRNGAETQELDGKAEQLLQQARKHVEQRCLEARAEDIAFTRRIPRLPASDPRAPELAALRSRYRALQQWARKSSGENKDNMLTEGDGVLKDAAEILKCGPVIGQEPMDTSPS